MRYGRLIVGAVLGMATVSSQAAAQESRQLKIGLHADVTHDSNVTASSKSQAALRGLTPEDTIFTPSVTFDALAPMGRQALFLRGSAGYIFHDANKRLDRESLDLTGGLNGRFGPCATIVTLGYSRGLSQYEDPLLVLSVENVQDVKQAKLDVGCSRETGFGVILGASKNWITNDLALVKESDSESRTVTAGIGYKRPTFGSLSLFVNQTQVEYPNRPANSGYEMQSAGLTYERKLGARIEGTVTVAYTTVDQESTGVGAGVARNLDGATYSGQLTYRVNNRMRLQGSVDRAITPSTGLGRTYDVTQGYRVGGEYDLGSRITFSLGGGQVERDSEGSQPVVGLALTNSTTKVMYGAVRYKQSDRLSFVLNVARDERTTNTPQFDYTSNRIGLAADVTF